MKKEFDQAFEFLGEIADQLKLSRDRVVVIPGNHDINWMQCLSYFAECKADERPPEFPWFPKWKQFKEAFDKFYQDFPAITFTPAEPWTLFDVKDLAVVVAGLNSTMDEGHDDAVNSRQRPSWRLHGGTVAMVSQAAQRSRVSRLAENLCRPSQH